MKGNAECHTSNDKYREGYDRVFKKETKKSKDKSKKK